MKLSKTLRMVDAAALVLLCNLTQAQEGFPEKPFALLVPWAAGDPVDAVAAIGFLQRAMKVTGRSGSDALQ